MKVRIQFDHGTMVKVTILDSNGVKIEGIPDEFFNLLDVYIEDEDDIVLDFDGELGVYCQPGL